MPNRAKHLFVFVVGLLLFAPASGQSPELKQFIQQAPKITADEAVARALEASSLTYHGSPFHALLVINQPSNPDSQFQGTVEIYWASATRYRVTVTSRPFSQTRIVNGDAIEETNIGDFYPSWLRNYFLAVFELLPRADEFRTDQKTPVMLGSNVSQSCVNRDDRPNGITDMMTWAQICFQGAEPRVKYTMDFTYFMEYGDYQSFGNKIIARTYTDYDKNNDKVLGKLTILEPLKPTDEALLEVKHPTPAADRIETHFVQMATNEQLLEKAPVIEWPSIHEGKTEGNMIIHVLTDRTGQVREAYGHNSDAGGVLDFGAQQALKYKFKPLLLNGAPVQMETPLVIHFTTRIENPLPVLTGNDIAEYAPGCGYNQVLPAGVLPSGTIFKIRVSVNEQGKETGEIFPQNVPWEAVQKAHLNLMSCRFKVYKVNGVPWYHHIDFEFRAP